jgi:hypothetical protein
MPIDPSIPLQVKNIKLESPMNQLAMMGEAVKLGEMQRGVDTQNKLRELYSQGIDVGTPEGFKQVASLDPATALKLRADALQGRKLEGEIKKTGFELTERGMGIMRERSKDLLQNPSNENYIAHIQEGLRDGLISPEQAKRSVQIYTAIPANERVAYITQGLAKAEKIYETNTVSAAQQQSNLTTIRGQDLTAQTTRRGQDLVDLRTREGQEMQYNPDLQARIAEAKASGEFMGKNKAAAAAALPGALEAASEGIRLIDEMVGQAEVRDKSGKVITKGTAPHPGFSNYVGGTLRPGMRFLEGSDAASFEVRQKQIEGKAFLEAFQTLKGGGAITEKEGEKGTAAIMRMNKASNEKEYVAAARELQGILRTGMDRARTKAGNPAPSGGGGGVIDFNTLN